MMLIEATLLIEVSENDFDGPGQVDLYIRDRLANGPAKLDVITLDVEESEA